MIDRTKRGGINGTLSMILGYVLSIWWRSCNRETMWVKIYSLIHKTITQIHVVLFVHLFPPHAITFWHRYVKFVKYYISFFSFSVYLPIFADCYVRERDPYFCTRSTLYWYYAVIVMFILCGRWYRWIMSIICYHFAIRL